MTDSTTFVISKKPKSERHGSDAITVTTTPAVGENGFTTFAQENPFNDVLVEVPPIGSSNGIQQLEDQGTHGTGATSKGVPINVAPLDLATSARAPALTATKAAGDDKGLNFVAYAQDAVDWIHWTSVSGVATPSSAVTQPDHAAADLDLREPGLHGTGRHDRTPRPTGPATEARAAPIAIYIANAGSGVESAWATLLGLTAARFPFGGEDPNHVIFQNETSSILANHDEADAIFFFSYGRFETVCAPNPTFCSGASTSKVALGEINGVKPSAKTIEAQLPGLDRGSVPGRHAASTTCTRTGRTRDIPAAPPAALNAASEDGFLCKPSTSTDVDPEHR